MIFTSTQGRELLGKELTCRAIKLSVASQYMVEISSCFHFVVDQKAIIMHEKGGNVEYCLCVTRFN